MRLCRDRCLLWLLLVFAATRLLLLLFDFPELTQLEELYNGTLAREMVRGPFLPVLTLRYVEYQSGSLVVSFMAIPLFLVFGDSYFSLKLVALAFSAATLAVYYLFLRDYYSRGAAAWGGLLYIFSPRIFALLNLKVEGANSQAILITMVMLLLFFKMLRAQEEGRGGGSGQAFVLGLLSTFGIWFCPVVIITALCVLIIWLAANRRFVFTRNGAVAIIGCAVGALPAILDYLKTNFIGIRYLLTQPMKGCTLRAASYFVELWGRGLRASFSSRGIWLISGDAINWYFYLLTLLCLAIFIIVYRASIVLFVASILRGGGSASCATSVVAMPLLYIVLFSLFYSVTKFHIRHTPNPVHNYRYLVSLYPFLFATMALAREAALGRVRVILSTLLTAGMLLGMVQMITPLDRSKFGEGFSLKGYSYEMLGLRMYELFRRNPQRALDLIDAHMKVADERAACVMGLAISMSRDCLERPEGVRAFVNRLDPVQERWRPWFYRALGQTLGVKWNSPDALVQWQESLGAIDTRYLPYYYEGLGAAAAEGGPVDKAWLDEAIRYIPPQFRDSFGQGMGSHFYVL